MSALASKDNRVSAPDIPFRDRLGKSSAEKVHGVGVASARGEHERGLVVFVEGDTVGFVVQGEQDFDDGDEAQEGGEVEGGVGEAGGVVGGVVERVGE